MYRGFNIRLKLNGKYFIGSAVIIKKGLLRVKYSISDVFNIDYGSATRLVLSDIRKLVNSEMEISYLDASYHVYVGTGIITGYTKRRHLIIEVDNLKKYEESA